MQSATPGTDRISVEELEVFAHVGVTENERAAPQRLTLTITVWPNQPFETLEDDISRTANYSAISAAAREFVANAVPRLIETLAAQLAAQLLEGFPIHKVEIEVRKFVLPDAKHVAVMITRSAG